MSYSTIPSIVKNTVLAAALVSSFSVAGSEMGSQAEYSKPKSTSPTTSLQLAMLEKNAAPATFTSRSGDINEVAPFDQSRLASQFGSELDGITDQKQANLLKKIEQRLANQLAI